MKNLSTAVAAIILGCIVAIVVASTIAVVRAVL